jgi:hypothetical protein
VRVVLAGPGGQALPQILTVVPVAIRQGLFLEARAVVRAVQMASVAQPVRGLHPAPTVQGQVAAALVVALALVQRLLRPGRAASAVTIKPVLEVELVVYWRAARGALAQAVAAAVVAAQTPLPAALAARVLPRMAPAMRHRGDRLPTAPAAARAGPQATAVVSSPVRRVVTTAAAAAAATVKVAEVTAAQAA